MRLYLLIGALLAGGALRAEDPWIGTWRIVWASASHDNPVRVTIAKQQGELRITYGDRAPRAMRRVDLNTADYNYEGSSGQQVPTHCAASADGKALTFIWKSATGKEGLAVYDRVDAGPTDSENRMVGVWLFNEPQSALRRDNQRVYQLTESGALHFRVEDPMVQTYTAPFDGKDHPLAGDPIVRSVALKRIDARTFEESRKDAGGKEVQLRRVTVSEDGTELTQVSTGRFTGGQGHRVQIFRKLVPEKIISRLAGVWKEDVNQRRDALTLPLRFRKTADGGLEQLRGPEASPRVDFVRLDGKPHPMAGSKDTMAWTRIDADQFESRYFAGGEKLAVTHRYHLSPDGKTLTKETEAPDTRDKFVGVFRRTAGDPPGLAGTWAIESFQAAPYQMTFQPLGADAVKVTVNNGPTEHSWTVKMGGPPAPVTGTGPWADSTTVTARQSDDSALEMSHWKDGAVFLRTVNRISSDGRILTSMGTNLGPEGPRGTPTTVVFRKQ